MRRPENEPNLPDYSDLVLYYIYLPAAPLASHPKITAVWIVESSTQHKPNYNGNSQNSPRAMLASISTPPNFTDTRSVNRLAVVALLIEKRSLRFHPS